MKELPLRPDFKEIEAKWQKWWEEKKIYRFDRRSKKPVFSIDTPPPTVSGDLHIGHAFSYTHFDIMGRYKRLRGFNVLQPLGFDDNGHPTETFIEKQHKIDSKKMKKAEFNKIVMAEIPKWEENYKYDLISLGHGYDWSITYSTISPESQALVQRSFLDLYKKDLAYRAEAPTIWCTHCQTALSQADLENRERETKLNYIYFTLEDGSKIEIATTRPEFLPATVALFVNPTDKRYKKYIGKTAKVPLFDLRVPILTDDAVDPEFGSGFMMVCSFGDKEDIDKWRRHKLDTRIIINRDGTLNKIAGKYAGLTLTEARTAILEDLEGQGLLIKQEPLKQAVSVCWRCPTPVEFIVTKQWFIKILNNKKKWIELGRKIKWHPKHHLKLYENWVKSLNYDWLISRQRHFGPPIPVWYCKTCGKELMPSEKDLPLDPERDKPKRKCTCGSAEFEPEHDVFETWMTSSMTPQLIIGWDNKRFPKVFPFTLRSSARDIIRTWQFYTIVKSWYHFKSIPWTNIQPSGMVFDPRGKEMHKSKGNVIVPQEVIKKFCADAFRYWTIFSTVGEDLWYQEEKVVHAQKLLIKLWNVAKFTVHNLRKAKIKPELIDSWILSKLSNTVKEYINSFDNYNPTGGMHALEQFFIHEFCDFYLEMSKYRIYGSDRKSKLAVQATLYTCLETILQLWAPIFPHLTEEIYQSLFNPETSIHQTEINTKIKSNKKALELGDAVCEVISEIRRWKQSKNMSLGAEVESLEIQYPEKLDKILDVIKGTMRIKDLKVKKGKLEVK